MRKKKKPLRKCIVCNERKEKKDLLRIVKNKETGISIDETGKMNGRGTYLCKNSKCINKAIKNKLLNRALKTNVPNDVYEKLDKEFNFDE